jgi:hypothetical protein
MKQVMVMLFESLAKVGLDKLERALMFGGGLVLVLAVLTGTVKLDHNWFSFLFRWLHVMCGIMWIGLLWYFNFVQIPSMPNIPDEQKPAISKVIAPTALYWFRYAALATVVTGLIVAAMNGYIVRAMSLGFIGEGPAKDVYIGIGMWLGLIMAFNVWEHHLAQSENRARDRRRLPRRQEGCRPRRHAGQPLQHHVLHPGCCTSWSRPRTWANAQDCRQSASTALDFRKESPGFLVSALDFGDDGRGDVAGAVGRILLQIGRDGRPLANHVANRLFDFASRLQFTEVFQQHGPGQNHGCRVGDALIRDVGRAAMHGFENGGIGADVGAGRQSQPANQAGRQIGQDVAE